jgi:hypothetical protein
METSKRISESGSPCFSPRLGLIGSPRNPIDENPSGQGAEERRNPAVKIEERSQDIGEAQLYLQLTFIM